MKLPNKSFSDYTIVEANLEHSGLPFSLKVYYTYQPESLSNIKNNEYLSDSEPDGISIDDVIVQLSDSAEIALSEYIRDYLMDL
jgi:hypothetical protein